jgi:hypothetical protein
MARNSWLDRQLPHSPRSVREAYPRLVSLAFWLGAFLLGVIPKHHVALLVGLWFQLGAAALLWYEANASSATMMLVIADLRQPFHPITFAERAMGWVSRFVLWLMWSLAYAFVALQLVVQAKPERSVRAAELIWVGIFLLLAGGIVLAGRLWDRSLVNLRKSMMNGLPSEEETKVRRYLRTVAFVLLILGTLGQMIDTLF